MQLTIEVPDSIGKTIKRSPEAKKFIVEALKEISEKLTDFGGKEKPKTVKPSKWAKLVERIENDPLTHDPEFQKAWKQMRVDMREFRENFEFKHDQ